ncbi:MAG TPA: dienelactone hydrolase family protein [Acidimicrobiia bacterium]|jgi:carboxymethylenebutenolidase
MKAETIELSTADGPMALYEAVPDGDARGAVIVIQEAFGVNSHIEDVTRRFADAGYVAVAPALFHRAGGGSVGYDEFDKLMPMFEGLDDDAVLMDVDAAIARLHELGFQDSSIGIVGFCFGGRVVFLVAARRALGAGVTFYGGGITHDSRGMAGPLADEAGSLQTPWLGLFGDQDAMIPVDGVEALRDSLGEVDVNTMIVRYPEAGHGFHCDQRADYHEESAKDGWDRTLAWFSDHLSPAG